MNNNTKVETTQKSQATNKKTSKLPTGKVTLIKETEARKKAREEQFRNFRINALRRRCKRMGFDEEKTEELVKKLIEQMDAPKEYSILITFDQKYPRKKVKKEEGEVFKKDVDIFLENITKNNIKYNYKGDTYVSISGNQDVLAKIREIAPDSAKIYPYAKKMESVLPKAEPKKKKPSNNSKEKAADAKIARKLKNIRIHRNKKTGKTTKRIVLKTLSAVKKRKPSVVVHLKPKKASEGSKTAKKAA